jgi:hypothetical protein
MSFQTTPDIPDMASTLLAPLNGRYPTAEELNLLTGDAHLIIGAGRHVFLFFTSPQLSTN